MVRAIALPVCVAFLLCAASAQGSVMTVTLGDVDGLGYGLMPGQLVPSLPFNNREPDDPTFSDFGVSGETNAWFTFTYAAIVGDINSASLRFGLAGMEDLKSDTPGQVFDDRLFLDDTAIPGAFDNDYTGIWTYGIVNLSVPSTLYSLLSDGTAAFFFDGWPYGTSATTRPGDQVSFDYVTLSIDYTEPTVTLPEPATVALVALGAAIVAAARSRRRKA